MKRFKQFLENVINFSGSAPRLTEGEVIPFKKKEPPTPPEHQGHQYQFRQIHGGPRAIQKEIADNHPHLLKHISGVGKQIKYGHKVMKMSNNPVNNTGWKHDGYLIKHEDGSDTGVDLQGKHYALERVPLK